MGMELFELIKKSVKQRLKTLLSGLVYNDY